MRASRRELLGGLAAATLVASAAAAAPRRAAGRIRAVAFDAFPIFDPRPIGALASELFPGKGAELVSVWRTRQFEYTWLRTVSGRYQDFRRTTEDALVYAASATKVALDDLARRRLMDGFASLRAWSDVRPVLEALRAAGVRMAFLSNFTAAMLDAAVASSGLGGFFEPHLTTDRVRAFKPDRRAYQMGVDAFGLRREEIVFVASAPWDAAGAKWFGYPTLWIDRVGSPPEELGVTADATAPNLAVLLELVKH